MVEIVPPLLGPKREPAGFIYGCNRGLSLSQTAKNQGLPYVLGQRPYIRLGEKLHTDSVSAYFTELVCFIKKQPIQFGVTRLQ